MHDLETLSAQVALERLARERPPLAAATRDVGDALGTDVLGMHAAGEHLATLPGAERFRVVVAGDRDLTAEDE